MIGKAILPFPLNDAITTTGFPRFVSQTFQNGDVKSDRNSLKLFAVQVPPDLMDAINEDLGVQSVFLSDNWVGGGMWDGEVFWICGFSDGKNIIATANNRPE
ncbi:MAG: hypothetical protein OD815_001833 [Candidatus Alkanophagales archaeon MCA70_species_2]|nr:hypothetical protein [Candidatus Alkanophaga liquidiphilum]